MTSQDASGDAPLRIALFGATGRMGVAVKALIADDPLVQAHAEVLRDAKNPAELMARNISGRGETVENLLPQCQVAIDFTLPDAVGRHAALCGQYGVPYVCGVTALSADTQALLEATSERLPVLWAPNMSTGVTVCFGAAQDIAARLGSGFNVVINDIHHAGKKDAPSGTALEFGRVIQGAAKGAVDVRYESVREGSHPGEHHIVFTAGGDRIELRHRAGSRDEFAEGALRAAGWLANQSSGFYNMRNVLGIATS